jgi:hypothetical protein
MGTDTAGNNMFLVALLAGIPAVLVAAATFIKSIMDARAAREDAKAQREEAIRQADRLNENTKLTQKVDVATDGNLSRLQDELRVANAQIAALFKFIAEAQLMARHVDVDALVRKEVESHA